MRAAVEGYFPPVKYLLESGANAQAKDNVSDAITWSESTIVTYSYGITLFITPVNSEDAVHYTKFPVLNLTRG